MTSLRLQTPRLDLALQTPAEVLAWLDTLPAAVLAEVSPDWIANVRAATPGDAWSLGFQVLERSSGAVVGSCGFKGPPDQWGMVEIAYGIEPDRQNRGYATEAAIALVDFAIASGQVQCLRAHTRPGNNASSKVLTKCGFANVGEFLDPEDGLVNRWERTAT